MSNVMAAQPFRASLLVTLLGKHSEARVEHVSRGEVILHSFVGQENVYIVKSGFVKAYTIENSGDSKLQLVHSAGEIFPVTCFMNRRNDDASISEFEAMTDCTVIKIPKRAIWRLLSERLDIAQILLEQVAKQFTLCVAWTHNLSFKHANERLAYRLLYMGYRFGTRTKGGVIMLPEFNQMQIAETINMTRECVNRELHRLERLGIIATEDNRIFILKPRALRKNVDIESEQFML